ncbi:L-lysine cyclodeaminase [Polystyrenella longa]|uniref:L-lysine cyclodeaminase n=1 Tax=Polystyrenella longa TaxID=2528007 RepID=A0A518CP91_9PLAN|nr:ornithine cyclodeaminase family protein [Polystyrenella longa]QDU81047.1 L-lysine cyclodeaminase [Polystyrenella longa]
MSLLFIREEEAQKLIDMPQAIAAVEQVFRSLGNQEAQNVPRHRVQVPGVMLHSLSASVTPLGYVGWKNYITTRTAARFHIALYDQEGHWVALLEADWLGQLRTGAASGVTTAKLANPEAKSVAVFGSGKQARTQLEAVCAVRPVQQASVYSHTAANRESFALEMSDQLGISVLAAPDPATCLTDKEIVITATTSQSPLVTGDLLKPGMHINAIGSNALNRSELSADCFSRINQIVCDDLNSCRNEAGDFVEPLKAGTITWGSMASLAELLTENKNQRECKSDITLFKSVGMAIEDIAVAAHVYEAAKEQGVGTVLDI